MQLTGAQILLECLREQEVDTIYTFSWSGLISGIAVWLFVAVILVIGI